MFHTHDHRFLAQAGRVKIARVQPIHAVGISLSSSVVVFFSAWSFSFLWPFGTPPPKNKKLFSSE
jgi:hypothetical protein